MSSGIKIWSQITADNDRTVDDHVKILHCKGQMVQIIIPYLIQVFVRL